MAAVVGATPQEVEVFVESNKSELNGEALEVFRKMNPQDQKRVINDGGLRDCNNVVAVIKTRARKAKEMELLLSGGRPLVAPTPDVPPPVFVPEPTMEIAQFYLRAEVQEVDESERRFASAATTQAKEGDEDGALEGTVRAVGGVLEIMKAKYGCGSGQRLRVIGQTSSMWQLEGGKTVPKTHNNIGWRWIIKGETQEQSSKSIPPTPGKDERKIEKKAEHSEEKKNAEPSEEKKKAEPSEEKKKDDKLQKKVQDKDKTNNAKGKKAEKKNSRSRSSSRGRSKKKASRKKDSSSTESSSDKKTKKTYRRASKSSESKSKKRRRQSSSRSDSRKKKTRRKKSSSRRKKSSSRRKKSSSRRKKSSSDSS